MSQPTAQCTVTGTWPETDGTKAAGRYLVTPTYEALGTGVMVPVTDVPVTLDANGTGIASLTYIPGATQWKITEQVDGADNPAPYAVTPDGPTLDLSTAFRSPPQGSPWAEFVVKTSVGQPGGPGGPLDADGVMPPNQLPATGGGIPASTVTAKGDLIVATGAGTVVRQPVGGTDGNALVVDSASDTGLAYAAVGGGGGGAAVQAFTADVFTSGSVTPSSASTWAPLLQSDGTSLFSRTLPAIAGNLISVNANTMFHALDSTTHLDLGIIVNGAIERVLSNMLGTPPVEGDPGWYPNSSEYKYHPAPPEFIVESGDLEGGNVTVAIIVKGATGTFYAEVDYPFRMSMKNLGTPTTVV
jgi:hypothetical protein